MSGVVFHNERLPENIEQGARGGPGFKTAVLVLNSGKENRNVEWSRTRGQWDISYGIQGKDDQDIVVDFFYARQGRAYGFRFKDWTDFKMRRQGFASGDGSTTVIQAYKLYGRGVYIFRRKLTRLVEGTDQIWVDGVLLTRGVDYTVDVETGEFTFASPPSVSTAYNIELEVEFDVPVRFDTDELKITAIKVNNDEVDDEDEEQELTGITSLNIIEIKE